MKIKKKNSKRMIPLVCEINNCCWVEATIVLIVVFLVRREYQVLNININSSTSGRLMKSSVNIDQCVDEDVSTDYCEDLMTFLSLPYRRVPLSRCAHETSPQRLGEHMHRGLEIKDRTYRLRVSAKPSTYMPGTS